MEYIIAMPSNCPNCGKPYPGKLRRCYDCKPQPPRTGAEIPCANPSCRKPRYVSPSEQNRLRYCNAKCRSDHHAQRVGRITRPCANPECNLTVTRTPGFDNGRPWYHSRECSATARKVKKTTDSKRGRRPVGSAKDTRPCGWHECSRQITAYISQKPQTGPWFCSGSHRAKYFAQFRAGKPLGIYKPRTGATINCLVCRKEVYRSPAEIEQGSGRFCSAEHWREFERRKASRTCEYCGGPIRLAPSQAKKYCSKEHEAMARTKRPLNRSHNGKPVKLDGKGYAWVWEPTHPQATKGWIQEHRFIMERMLGRQLTPDEQVDHIDQFGPKSDNRPENLQVMSPNGHAQKTQKAIADRLALLVKYEDQFGPLNEPTAVS